MELDCGHAIRRSETIGDSIRSLSVNAPIHSLLRYSYGSDGCCDRGGVSGELVSAKCLPCEVFPQLTVNLAC